MAARKSRWQVFTVLGAVPHVTKDGRHMLLKRLSTKCSACGRRAVLLATHAAVIHRKFRWRCDRCKAQGRRSKGARRIRVIPRTESHARRALAKQLRSIGDLALRQKALAEYWQQRLWAFLD